MAMVAADSDNRDNRKQVAATVQGRDNRNAQVVEAAITGQ